MNGVRFQPTPPARTETEFQFGHWYDQEFQPTPPARTETKVDELYLKKCQISTHSAREDGDRILITDGEIVKISTHSAREDGDPKAYSAIWEIGDFNPLRPRGRRQKISNHYL